MTIGQQLVENIRQWPGDWKSRPPDLHSLGQSMGVVGVEERSLTVQAMTLPVRRGYKIIINSNDFNIRKRFSWAHELGHILEAQDSIGVVKQLSHRDKKLERLCDTLAAEILMPTELFADDMISSQHGFGSVGRLANIYQTSITSTAIRYVNLLKIPTVLIRWAPAQGNVGLKPTWKLQNNCIGPIVPSDWHNQKSSSSTFEGAESAYTWSKLEQSYEKLLARVRVGTQQFIRFSRYKTESMGFGTGRNRFVLSIVYLNDFIDDIAVA